MSEVMGSSIRKIYVPLLGEGTPVVRPTQGISLGGDLYRVLATPDYDASHERWEFPPGSVVCGIKEKKDGEEIIVARNLARNPGTDGTFSERQ